MITRTFLSQIMMNAAYPVRSVSVMTLQITLHALQRVKILSVVTGAHALLDIAWHWPESALVSFITNLSCIYDYNRAQLHQ